MTLHGGVTLPGLDRLADLMAGGGTVVLSGAGISTESGIPDYRGPSGSSRRQAPMTYAAFRDDPRARQRYWARSHLGWRLFDRAEPNAGHRAVAQLEGLGVLDGVVTQNVDGLHQAAGAREVLDLHGRLDRVVCLTCGSRSSRPELDRRLRAANPGFTPDVRAVQADGDVELAEHDVRGFTVVACAVCGGTLKPDVVFFGETVPPDRVRHSFALVDDASALLVLGSSLTVMSGYRFVLRAVKLGIPVAIVNQGPTRGDDRAWVRLDAPLGQVLPALVERVHAGRGAGSRSA